MMKKIKRAEGNPSERVITPFERFGVFSDFLLGDRQERVMLRDWYRSTQKKLNGTKFSRYLLFGVLWLQLPVMISIAGLIKEILPLLVAGLILIPIGLIRCGTFFGKAELEKWKLYRRQYGEL